MNENTQSKLIIKIIPLKLIDDEKVKKKLKNLNSLYNMGILKNWKTIKMVKCHIIQKYQFTLRNIN